MAINSGISCSFLPPWTPRKIFLVLFQRAVCKLTFEFHMWKCERISSENADNKVAYVKIKIHEETCAAAFPYFHIIHRNQLFSDRNGKTRQPSDPITSLGNKTISPGNDPCERINYRIYVWAGWTP